MPECHRETVAKQTEMVVWSITETEADLAEGLSLSTKALDRLAQRKSSIHRKGYLAIRQLLKSLGIRPETHQYDPSGAPYLTDGRYISISHTQNIAAVVISPIQVGIDIEYYQDKIIRIGPRFLHHSEITFPKTIDPIVYLTQIWTAKEALYKLYKKPGIHFGKQLCIHPFQSDSNTGTGEIFDDQKTTTCKLYFRKFENYCLTLATHK